MSKFPNNRETFDFGFGELESIVESAGDYIHPTDNLRPKTLEAARTAKKHRLQGFRLGTILLCLTLMALTGLPGNMLNSGSPATDKNLQSVRRYDLHQQASLRILHTGLDPSWALYEAFVQLRAHQAELFEESK